MMKARPDKLMAEESEGRLAVSEHRGATEEGIDYSLLDESLTQTPWERMQANDDALRFADSLRAAMEKRNAESQ
jgi:hypothetical protein